MDYQRVQYLELVMARGEDDVVVVVLPGPYYYYSYSSYSNPSSSNDGNFEGRKEERYLEKGRIAEIDGWLCLHRGE